MVVDYTEIAKAWESQKPSGRSGGKSFWLAIRVAIEKQIPKKPLHNGANWYKCPNGCEVHKKIFEKDWYCPKCGQAIKWKSDAKEDLDILISEFCVPLGIDTICDELHDWDMDLKGETWCSINCGKENDGQCPSANCYKEWIKMKKVGAE